MMNLTQLFPTMIIAKNAGLTQQEAMQVAVRSSLQGQAFNIGDGAAILLAKQEADRMVANKAAETTESTGTGGSGTGGTGQTDPKGGTQGPILGPAADDTADDDPGIAIRRLIVELIRLLRAEAEDQQDDELSEKFDEAIKALLAKLEKVIDDDDTPAEQVLDVALALAGRTGVVSSGEISKGQIAGGGQPFPVEAGAEIHLPAEGAVEAAGAKA